MITKGERFNVVSHLIGAILTVPAVVVLVRAPLIEGDLKKVVCFLVYGVALLLVYVTSTLFHSTSGRAREICRHYDRIAIYFLIGGSYTPIMLLGLPSPWNWLILSITWVMVVIAVVIEHRPALLKHSGSVEFYVLMGWMAFPLLLPLAKTITIKGILLLVGGGLIITLGAAAVRWRLVPRCHEVWHVAVLAGTSCHYVMMLLYLS